MYIQYIIFLWYGYELSIPVHTVPRLSGIICFSCIMYALLMITGREGHTVKSAVANDDASSPPVITNNAHRVL